jgi:hypothetical protein
MKLEHPNGNRRKLKKFYTRQNELIDQFLGADDEERLAVEEHKRMGPRIKFAVNASFIANFFLFVIQLYAAISTGSLAVRIPNSFWTPSPCAGGIYPNNLQLFATAADAFVRAEFPALSLLHR